MGTMLKYGSEGAKQFYEMFILDPAHAKAHREGDIHIHDLDFLTLTTTCCQIDLLKLFQGGFPPVTASARAERHPFVLRAGLHRHPVQPERPAWRAVVSELRLLDGPGRARRPSAALFKTTWPRPLRCTRDDNSEVDARALTERVRTPSETGKWACWRRQRL